MSPTSMVHVYKNPVLSSTSLLLKFLDTMSNFKIYVTCTILYVPLIVAPTNPNSHICIYSQMFLEVNRESQT
jgi:hypothetical protein